AGGEGAVRGAARLRVGVLGEGEPGGGGAVEPPCPVEPRGSHFVAPPADRVSLSSLPHPRDQPVPDPLCVLLVPSQLFPEGLVLPDRFQDEERAQQNDWDQSPQDTQNQRAANN